MDEVLRVLHVLQVPCAIRPGEHQSILTCKLDGSKGMHHFRKSLLTDIPMSILNIKPCHVRLIPSGPQQMYPFPHRVPAHD